MEELDHTPSFSPLSPSDKEIDIAIIGGGITGITTAYYLAKAGRQVALLEQGVLLQGDTSLTTAFVTHAIDANLQDLKKTFDEETAKNAWQSAKETIDEIERLIQYEHLDCEATRCPAFIFPADLPGRTEMEEEVKLASSLGFPLQWSSESFLFAPLGVATLPNQFKFHPVKYLQQLTQKAMDAGAKFYEHTHVHDFDGDGPFTLYTSHGTLRAQQLVVATHGPVVRSVEFPARLKAQRTYVIQATIPTGVLPEGLYWNTEAPYHYVRVDKGTEKDHILVGGEDHLTGKSPTPEAEHFSRLEMYLYNLLPPTEVTIEHQWSGQIYESLDGLPYIGRAIGKAPVYIATGYAGDGMIFGSMAAKMISSIICNGFHPWENLYKTLRPHGIKMLAEQSVNFIKELIQRDDKTEVASIDEIPTGTGKIMSEDGKPVAVFKTPNGKILKCSAICTHLHCTVGWNDIEKSWDCPCHGSRFDTNGAVLNGPAREPLAQIK